MRETPGSVFCLDGLAQVTQPLVCLHILFSKLYFFSMTVFKRESINQSLLTWLKILVIFFMSFSMESSLVADWWWTVWFDILFTFSQLLNLHPCCRIRETKWVQRTISVIEFSEVVMFKHWTQHVWSKSGILFVFSRHAQPPLGLWLRTLQCEWINILLRTLSIWFLLDHNALRFSLHLAESVLKEIQKTNDCSFFIFFLWRGSDLV